MSEQLDRTTEARRKSAAKLVTSAKPAIVLKYPSNRHLNLKPLVSKMPPRYPSAEEIKAFNDQWIDPITEAPESTLYRLYPTPSRGPDTQGSYLAHLPENYNRSDARYPVLYWLHGGFGNARQGAGAVRLYAAAMWAGRMPQTIVVLPQALPVGWYVNSKDGQRPIEDVIVRDLVSHADSTYRTINAPEARWIEGFSMGGYGALRLGFKFPGLFGAVSAIGPSILPRLEDEPRERTFDTFGDDQACYDDNAPWTLARANAEALRGVRVRVLSGSRDGSLAGCIRDLSALLTELCVGHERIDVDGAGHDYEAILEGIGDKSYGFWDLEPKATE